MPQKSLFPATHVNAPQDPVRICIFVSKLDPQSEKVVTSPLPKKVYQTPGELFGGVPHDIVGVPTLVDPCVVPEIEELQFNAIASAQRLFGAGQNSCVRDILFLKQLAFC